MKAYKIVRKFGSRYYSANIHLPNSCIGSYYKGKANKPKLPNSVIFCFRTAKRAKEFLAQLESNYIYEIWQVEIPDGSKRLDSIVPVWVAEFSKEARKLWRGVDARVSTAPSGTVGAKSMKFIKQVL